MRRAFEARRWDAGVDRVLDVLVMARRLAEAPHADGETHLVGAPCGMTTVVALATCRQTWEAMPPPALARFASGLAQLPPVSRGGDLLWRDRDVALVKVLDAEQWWHHEGLPAWGGSGPTGRLAGTFYLADMREVMRLADERQVAALADLAKQRERNLGPAWRLLLTPRSAWARNVADGYLGDQGLVGVVNLVLRSRAFLAGLQVEVAAARYRQQHGFVPGQPVPLAAFMPVVPPDPYGAGSLLRRGNTLWSVGPSGRDTPARVQRTYASFVGNFQVWPLPVARKPMAPPPQRPKPSPRPGAEDEGG